MLLTITLSYRKEGDMIIKFQVWGTKYGILRGMVPIKKQFRGKPGNIGEVKRGGNKPP